MSRNAAQWLQQPKLPRSHFVDSRIYTDEMIFREEQQKVFDKSWIIACHESEIPSSFDYRTFQHPGGTPLIVVRSRAVARGEKALDTKRRRRWCSSPSRLIRLVATRSHNGPEVMPCSARNIP